MRHALGKRHEEVVPVIHGFRVPTTGLDSSQEKLCKRAVLSLVLFHPFRRLDDLIGVAEPSDHAAWLNAFTTWKSTRTTFVETIMDNMDDFYSGVDSSRRQGSEKPVADVDPRVSDHDSGSASEDDDLFREDDFDVVGGDTVPEDCAMDEHLHDVWDFEADDDAILDISSLDPASCPTSPLPDRQIMPMLDLFKQHSILHHAVKQTATVGASTDSLIHNLPSIASMKKWVRDGHSDNAILVADTGTYTAVDTKVVELLDTALMASNLEWHTPKTASIRGSPDVHQHFATILQVSREYSLNERQHYAFRLIGCALLSRWRHAELLKEDCKDLASVLRESQLLLFLGGEGGTGKTRIVDAVQDLCKSWGRSRSLVKAALTGKAATLINGRTLASFLLQIRKREASDAIVEMELIIIDEVSMMKKFQLAQLDARLRAAKRVPDVPFGGVHVVLVGDFLQLPPVGGQPLYADPAQRTYILVNELAGFQLWQQFVDVIMLKENVRFREDPEWGQGCHQARLGIWTPAFVRLINSRVISCDDGMMNERFQTFVTPDNKTRVSINNLFISKLSEQLPEGEYPVRVVANFKRKLSALKRSEVREIMALPKTKFGRMPPYVDLIVGMPVQITQNIRAEKMIANGTLGRLEAIVYHPETTFRLVYDNVAGIVVKIPSIPPPCVVVRVDRGPIASPMQGCIDADLFPLFHDTQAYGPCQIALAGTLNGVPRSLNVRIQQFPLVCAVASTVYKVQGETLDGMVVTEWRSRCVVANKKEQPYLLVSRVTSRVAFATLTPLSEDIIRWAHPSEAALDEEARLNRLSDETIARLHSLA
jgi:hypothetical protein